MQNNAENSESKRILTYDVAVIGGGPAGMMSAGRAGELGAKVVLIEKNPELGRKLLITGGGRCNVTNAEFDNRKLLEKFKDNGKFLFSAFSQWDSRSTIDFFNKRGMPTKVENENRAFPTSNKSSSVLEVLLKYLSESHVDIITNSPVTKLTVKKNIDSKSDNDSVNLSQIDSVVLADGTEIFAKSFILATGGTSYPKTGSTGDGFNWLKDLGHKIIKADSALVPVNIKNPWVKKLQGVTLPNVKISIIQDQKKIETKAGKILFTHFGVSGPTIINMSRKINELIPYGDVYISVDIMPDHDFSTLNTSLQNLFKQNSNKMIKNALSEMTQSAVVDEILDMTKIKAETFCHSITREERIKIMHTMKSMRMEVDSLMSPENAIVSSGGIELNEVDFKTMRSKLFKNLHVTGDLLNINRPSGGYSLQLCWTTGFVAGTHATNK